MILMTGDVCKRVGVGVDEGDDDDTDDDGGKKTIETKFFYTL
jgi:hypothetical protein